MPNGKTTMACFVLDSIYHANSKEHKACQKKLEINFLYCVRLRVPMVSGP